ncbi:MAG: NADH-quinone oxidoreductase subunit C [Candidatus Zixiibacteriota bacterium]
MSPEELRTHLSTLFGGKLRPLDSGRDAPLFELAATELVETVRGLRDDETVGFDFLNCISCIDTGERMEIVYSLSSISHSHRLDLKIVLPRDGAEVDSVIEIWPAANWYEREIWELYGIQIRNHPNLTRFLLPDDWDQGHPMRKDWDAPDFVRMPE